MKKSVYLFFCVFSALLLSCEKEPTVSSIALDNSTYSLKINETHQFSVTHKPENLPAPSYIWSTSNANIVSVNNNGLITANSIGNATITVSTTDKTLKDSCKVTVLPILATGITLDIKSIELFIDQEITLTYTITPENTTDKQVIWSSANNNIAIVDNTGKVKAISKGETQISVKTNNLISDICNVKVKPINATSISINKNTLSIEISDKEILIVSFTPNNTTNKKVIWSSSNNEIASVNGNGEVTGTGEGNAIITATSEDGGFTAICNVEVKLKGLVLSKSSITTLPNQQEIIHVKYSIINTAYLHASWTSSNQSVSKVTGDGDGTNSALIETFSLGTATITATSADGSKTATCIVEVKEITSFISLKFIAEGLVIINGYIYGGVYSEITNNSPQSIELKSFYMYAGDTGALVAYSTNPEQLGILTPGASKNLGKILNSVYYPICKWTFIWNGNSHEVSHQFKK